MFTANPELRSFLLWLDVFTRYKKKSAAASTQNEQNKTIGTNYKLKQRVHKTQKSFMGGYSIFLFTLSIMGTF